MPKRKGDSPLLTALLLGGWATVYIAIVIFAIDDLFPALAKIFPPLPNTFVLGFIITSVIYLVQQNLQK